jgi:hypothetical protein
VVTGLTNMVIANVPTNCYLLLISQWVKKQAYQDLFYLVITI